MNGIEPLGQLSPAFGLLLGLDKGRGAFKLAALPGRVELPSATAVASIATAVVDGEPQASRVIFPDEGATQ